jgi:hypothetical protein
MDNVMQKVLLEESNRRAVTMQQNAESARMLDLVNNRPDSLI